MLNPRYLYRCFKNLSFNETRKTTTAKKKKKKPRKFLQWREFASLTEREYGSTHGMLSLL